MTKKDFNELVYHYGASGSKAVEGFTDEEIEVVSMAWAAADVDDDEKSEKETDNIINSFYVDFQKAEKESRGKNSGLGYHGGGRPKKDTEARRKTISISGTPSEIEKLKKLAEEAGKNVSRFILDNIDNLK